MKQKIKTGVAAALLSLISLCSFSQNDHSVTPRWVSEKGYWVVEGNIHTPKNHVIRFYNNDDVLVYTETLTGVKLNTDRPKIRMKLKKVLESSVIAWEKEKKPREDEALVKAILK
ncbi:MAG: hypothetical protein Q8941_09225 [Bacteroidota bacterium]|nr:hypothetical protein [Bacteroidota bacterium]